MSMKATKDILMKKEVEGWLPLLSERPELIYGAHRTVESEVRTP
jgi:hypothetical protein